MVCFLLRRGGVCCCAFLDLRLYLFLLLGVVCWSILFFPVSVGIVLVVCGEGVTVVGVVGVGGFVMWAMCRLCCVFFVLCDCVLVCDILVLFLPHYYV